MKKAIIIEDEAVIARNLRSLIQKVDNKIDVLAILSSVNEGTEWLLNNPHPDLIFSDVQLADGTSFEIFEKVKVSCPVIFITAYDQYAIRAFRVNGIHYLMKPVSTEELQNAIQKYYQLTQSGIDQGESINQLIGSIRKKEISYKSRFLAHYLQNIIPVPMEHVSGFKKDQLIYLVTRDGKEMVTDYGSLDELEELVDPSVFFRANRQHMLHIDDIKDFKVSYNGKILVHLYTPALPQVEISREKAAAFKNWIG